MLIPFSDWFINTDQISRLKYLPGRRIEIVMSDGASLTVRNEGGDAQGAAVLSMQFKQIASETGSLRPPQPMATFGASDPKQVGNIVPKNPNKKGKP